MSVRACAPDSSKRADRASEESEQCDSAARRNRTDVGKVLASSALRATGPQPLCRESLRRDGVSGAVLHDVRHDQRERKEEQAQDEISEEAVPLTSRNPRGPKREAKPDDDSDDAQSPPQHVNLRCIGLIDPIFR